MDMFTSPEFWIAVGQIIMIDILLGGDNAVVIALACRSLPPAQRTKGIIWGTAGAIILRVILIFFALTLLKIPFLKIVGAILLIWIGMKLLMPEEGEGHGNVAASDKLWGAVKTVIVADLVMSVDNVIAIAGAAESAGGDHTMPLVIFGLLVSIPIIVWGSQLVLKLMDRYPIVITAGGMLLGWIAGTMAVTDPAVAGWVPSQTVDGRTEVLDSLRYGAGIAGALLVLALGKWMASRVAARAGVVVAPVAPAGVRRLRRVLLAVDGSEGAAAAARRIHALREELRDGENLELHVVNVQRPLAGEVSRFIAGKTIEDYHHERSDDALSAARAALGESVGEAHEHRLVGEPGPTLAETARRLGCDLIVMGARGVLPHTSPLVGSVTQSTIAHADVPVLVVK
jgi:YjbE family integral membrane protein